MRKLLSLLFLIPILVIAEDAPLDNKGLICSQVVKCDNEFPESKFHTSKYEALLESGACKGGYASINDIEKPSFKPLYMEPIRLWCKAHSCSQPFIDGNNIKDNDLPYEINDTNISVHRYSLNKKTLIMSQSFMNKPFYYRCVITTEKNNIYMPLDNKIKKAKKLN